MKETLHGIYPKLYGTVYDEADMDQRFLSLVENHKKLFGVEKPRIFSAAGRTEIAGNHTDHNLGLVIGGTINLDTIAAVSPREDNLIVFESQGYPTCTVDLSNLEVVEKEKNTTASLIRGIAKAFSTKGVAIKGWQANVTSRVLGGSGLSSSASVEVLIGEIFNNLFNEDRMDAVEIAKIGQYAENVYFGKPCGLLDQMCCAYGGVIGIDFKDNKNPVVTPLQVSFEDFELNMIITDTKGCHADLTEEYAAVPPEMKEIAHFYGKETCREVEPKDFFRDIKKIREAVKNDRALLRAYHFFTENQRVQLMLDELKNDDIESFLYNVTESGNSSFRFLQNVYPSSAPQEQGLSIAIAASESVLEGEGAVRVHGGGFAGTIQAYVPFQLKEQYVAMMESIFGAGCCTIIAIRNMPVSRIY